MTSCGDAKLFFCILFVTYCCTVTFSQIPMDCCLRVGNNTIAKQRVVNYFLQIGGQGCAMDAMVLMTRHKKNLCVPADEPWVKEVVKHVVTLKEQCKRRQYKGKRCYNVKQK